MASAPSKKQTTETMQVPMKHIIGILKRKVPINFVIKKQEKNKYEVSGTGWSRDRFVPLVVKRAVLERAIRKKELETPMGLIRFDGPKAVSIIKNLLKD